MEPSLVKLLIAAVVIWVVWRWVGRLNATKQAGRGDSTTNRQADNARQANARQANARQAERPVEDMVKCPKCGAYVPAKGGHDCSQA